MARCLLLCGLALLPAAAVVPLSAGTIDVGLQEVLAATPPDKVVSTLVFHKDQVNIDALNEMLNNERATLQWRHEVVVRSLQENAQANQGALRDHLRQLKSAERIDKLEVYWIVNCFRVDAVPAEIVELANHADVGTIYFNYPIELIEPVSITPGDQNARDVENGVAAVNAPQVWDMGYTGAGVLVANVDTGVDANHPALNSRWAFNADPQHYAGHPEWAWLDPYLHHDSFPYDDHGHGTHTMGTVCGGAPGLQIGVAPGAHWIAAGAIDRYDLLTTVADALESFQWLIDPDGDPSTNWDVPAVCSNSWGIGTWHNIPPYSIPCDPTFWSYLDACEAAGTVILFSAGNEGPSANSLRRPADRATDNYRTCAVAAVDAHTPGWPVASFSSQGPTDCTPNGSAAIKPDIAAPGVDVNSSYPGGGYTEMSGTSMASPHVNGVVALVREACPDLSVQDVKQVIFETAHDLGPAGEDNAYGWGMVDALAAVQAAEGMCGPHPPRAYDGYAETPVNTAVAVTLEARDYDQAPQPMVFIVTKLPKYELRDAGNNHVIAASEIPYTLVNNGNQVTYRPFGLFSGVDSFQFKANDAGVPPEGGDSNIANFTVVVGSPTEMYSFPLDTNPGWVTQGEWAFGDPAGQGGTQFGYPDPNYGATGANVYGVNLSGDYSLNVGGPWYLTAGPFGFTGATEVTLKFQRWLNSDYQPYVYATIEASNNGSTWSEIWSNGSSETAENSWSLRSYSLSSAYDNQATVYVRWGHQVGNYAWAYSGWNIDDIAFWARQQQLTGDMNCDGALNAFDIDPFVLALTNPAGYNATYPDCNIGVGDCNGDGAVDAFDIDGFVYFLTNP